MIDIEQLFKYIPKHIEEWTAQDVAKWFQLNSIDLQNNLNLNGSQFLKLTPKKLINQYKMSTFLARKISEWIESETQQFDEYVDEAKLNPVPQQSSQQQQFQIQSQKEQPFMRWSQESLPFRNIEMDSNIHKKDLDDKENAKSLQKPVRFLSSDSEESQNYQPFKYKPKCSEKKKLPMQKPEKQLESIKSQPFLNGKPQLKGKLVLDCLEQNDDKTFQQDAETCNHIPDNDSDRYEQRKRRQMAKIRSQNCLNQDPITNFEESQYSKQVKFVDSQLVLGGPPVLYAFYDNEMIPITKNMKIGRNSINDILLKTDGVSRSHAEIIVEEWPDVQEKMMMKYFIKDIGSKFGTFVQVDPEKGKKVSLFDCYSIGEYTIRIEELKVYKSKSKFDITVCACLGVEEKISFTGVNSVTIGNTHRQPQAKEPKNSQVTKRCSTKQRRDIELDDKGVKNLHCRLVCIGGEVILEQVEGNFLQRIEKNVKLELSRNKYDIKFGDKDVCFKFQPSSSYRPVNSYRSQ